MPCVVLGLMMSIRGAMVSCCFLPNFAFASRRFERKKRTHGGIRIAVQKIPQVETELLGLVIRWI